MTLNYKQSLSYYLKLFTSQYQISTKQLAFAQVVFQLWDDIATCAASINMAYALSVAVGSQQDYLGGILGVSRTVAFQPSGGVSPVLDDTTYKILLLATVQKNQWNGLTASLYPLWQVIFSGGTLIINDNQNMSCSIIISGSFTSIEKDLIVNGLIVPRPEGVEYNYYFASFPVLAADQNNAFFAGADLGHAV